MWETARGNIEFWGPVIYWVGFMVATFSATYLSGVFTLRTNRQIDLQKDAVEKGHAKWVFKNNRIIGVEERKESTNA